MDINKLYWFYGKIGISYNNQLPVSTWTGISVEVVPTIFWKSSKVYNLMIQKIQVLYTRSPIYKVDDF